MDRHRGLPRLLPHGHGHGRERRRERLRHVRGGWRDHAEAGLLHRGGVQLPRRAAHVARRHGDHSKGHRRLTGLRRRPRGTHAADAVRHDRVGVLRGRGDRAAPAREHDPGHSRWIGGRVDRARRRREWCPVGGQARVRLLGEDGAVFVRRHRRRRITMVLRAADRHGAGRFMF